MKIFSDLASFCFKVTRFFYFLYRYLPVIHVLEIKLGVPGTVII